jgi:hypothetical protein
MVTFTAANLLEPPTPEENIGEEQSYERFVDVQAHECDREAGSYKSCE